MVTRCPVEILPLESAQDFNVSARDSMQLSIYRNHQAFFDLKSSEWKFSDDECQQALRIFQGIHFSPKSTILDVGCGTGCLFPILEEISPLSTIIGCDFSFGMLKNSRQTKGNSRIPIVQCFGEMLPLKSGSFDILLNYCVFPHLKYKETAVREFNRVLKKGGSYYIIHPQGRNQINSIHHSIGDPVNNDLIPPTEEIIDLLKRNLYSIRQVNDCDDLFLIEATK